MFALLAFLCVPSFALAEDSGDIQYRDAPPSATGNNNSHSNGSSTETGDGGNAAGQSPTAPGSSGETGGDSSDKSGGAATGKDGGGGGQAGSGPNGKSDIGAGRAIDSAAPGASGLQSSDGGSSPLVPILIALAVLAAISVGVVAMRRRRQGPGGDSRVSPEVG